MARNRYYDDAGIGDALGMLLQLELARKTLDQRKAESVEEAKLAREKMAQEKGLTDAQTRQADSATKYNDAITEDFKNSQASRQKLMAANVKIAEARANREQTAFAADEFALKVAKRTDAEHIAARDAYKKALDKYQTDMVWNAALATMGPLDAHAARAGINRFIHNMTLDKQARDIRKADLAAAILEGKLDEMRLSGVSAEQAGRDYAHAVLYGKGSVPPPATAMGSLLLRAGSDRIPYSKDYLKNVTDPDPSKVAGFLEGQTKLADDVVSGKITPTAAKKLGTPGMPEEMVETLLMETTAVSETARELSTVLSGGTSSRFTKEQALERISQMKAGFQRGFAEEFNKQSGQEFFQKSGPGYIYPESKVGKSPQAQYSEYLASQAEGSSYTFPDSVIEGTGEYPDRVNKAVAGVRNLSVMDPSEFIGTISGSARDRFHLIADADPLYSRGPGLTYSVATETNRRITTGTAMMALQPGRGVEGDMVSAAERAYKDPSMALSYWNMISGPEAIKDFKEIRANGPGAAEAWNKWKNRIGGLEPEIRNSLMDFVIENDTPAEQMAVTQAQKTSIYQSVKAGTPSEAQLLEFDTEPGAVSKAASAIGLDIPDILNPPQITGLSQKAKSQFQTPEQILNTTDPAVRDIVYRSGYRSDYADYRRFLAPKQAEEATPTTQPTEPGRKNVPRTGDVDPQDVHRYATPMVRSYMNNGDILQMQKRMSENDLRFAKTIADRAGVRARMDQSMLMGPPQGEDIGVIESPELPSAIGVE